MCDVVLIMASTPELAHSALTTLALLAEKERDSQVRKREMRKREMRKREIPRFVCVTTCVCV